MKMNVIASNSRYAGMPIVTLLQAEYGVDLIDNVTGDVTRLHEAKLEDVIQMGIDSDVWTREGETLLEVDMDSVDNWVKFQDMIYSKYEVEYLELEEEEEYDED